MVFGHIYVADFLLPPLAQLTCVCLCSPLSPVLPPESVLSSLRAQTAANDGPLKGRKQRLARLGEEFLQLQQECLDLKAEMTRREEVGMRAAEGETVMQAQNETEELQRSMQELMSTCQSLSQSTSLLQSVGFSSLLLLS